MSKNQYRCPQCGGPLEVWAETDVVVKYSINNKGQRVKKVIENLGQSDARCGFDCQNCDWKVHGDDLEDAALTAIADSALESATTMDFSEKKTPRN